jgi:multidrug transporter EmrE-like cation transporter
VGKNNFIGSSKILSLSILVVLSNVMGNCLLNMGVKQGNLVSWASVLKLVASPTLVTGIVLLIAWMLLRMALLSAGPMSVVLPLTAGVGYVVTGGIGQFWFAEKVPITYDLGLILMAVGVLLVGTSGSTVSPEAPASDAEARTCAATAEYQT